MSARKKVQRQQAVRLMQEERRKLKQEVAILRALMGEAQGPYPEFTRVADLVKAQATTIARHEQTIATLRAALEAHPLVRWDKQDVEDGEHAI